MVQASLFLDSLTHHHTLGRVWNDKEEMEKLYVSFRDKIYLFLLKYTKNEDTAMDLLQDTFLSFFKSYGSSQISTSDAVPLLYRIARNRSINHSKKFSSQKEISEWGMELHPDSRNFEKKLFREDMETILQSCLDKMPDAEREILVLRYMEGLNLTQIGEIMQISISTASRMIVKATAMLVELAKEKGIHEDMER